MYVRLPLGGGVRPKNVSFFWTASLNMNYWLQKAKFFGFAKNIYFSWTWGKNLVCSVFPLVIDQAPVIIFVQPQYKVIYNTTVPGPLVRPADPGPLISGLTLWYPHCFMMVGEEGVAGFKIFRFL